MDYQQTQTGLSVVNGVEIWTENGITHFRPVEIKQEKPTEPEEQRGWFRRFIDWLTGENGARPYVKLRDQADPFNDRTDPDAGSDGNTGIEAGIRISF